MATRANIEKLEDHLFALGGRRQGNEIVFPCVSGTHEDRHPSAGYNLEKKVWHCFACGAGGTHEDRHPSAGYNLEKKVWHCFACGAGGGMKDLMMRLGLTTEKETPTRDGPYFPTRQDRPRFFFDWRKYSHELMFYSEGRFLHGHAVLTQAKGLDISGWTPEEIEIASNAACDAMQDIDESERVANLAFNLRAYGLEEESERNRESQRRKASYLG